MAMQLKGARNRALAAVVTAALTVALCAAQAAAGTWVASGVSPVTGHALSASAEFSLNGTTLTVVLKNTSSQSGGFVPSDGLTALYLDIANSPTLSLTKTGANAPIASSIWNGSSFSGPVNLEGYPSPKPSEQPPYWNLVQSATALAAGVGQHYGIGAAGLGIFGPNVDGLPFAIFPTGFDGTNGNAPVKAGPIAVDSTTFTITGFTGSLADISNVAFQYGTSLDEGRITGKNGNVPEPSSVAIWGLLGLACLGAHRWHRRRTQS